MTHDEFKDMILFRLGAPTVKVEIDEQAWARIFRATKFWFRTKKGVYKFAKFTLNGMQTEYDVPVDCNRVVEVVFPSNSDFFHLSLGLTNSVPSYWFGFGGRNNAAAGASEFVQFIANIETRKRMFSADNAWEQVGRKMIISGRGCYGDSISSDVILYYSVLEFPIETLFGKDEDMFFRYALAITKEVLGRIRGKYPSYPSAGGSISMDADVLLNESKEERAALDKEILESQGGLGTPITG